jgi:hypothetical protein
MFITPEAWEHGKKHEREGGNLNDHFFAFPLRPLREMSLRFFASLLLNQKI